MVLEWLVYLLSFLLVGVMSAPAGYVIFNYRQYANCEGGTYAYLAAAVGECVYLADIGFPYPNEWYTFQPKYVNGVVQSVLSTMYGNPLCSGQSNEQQSFVMNECTNIGASPLLTFSESLPTFSVPNSAVVYTYNSSDTSTSQCGGTNYTYPQTITAYLGCIFDCASPTRTSGSCLYDACADSIGIKSYYSDTGCSNLLYAEPITGNCGSSLQCVPPPSPSGSSTLSRSAAIGVTFLATSLGTALLFFIGYGIYVRYAPKPKRPPAAATSGTSSPDDLKKNLLQP